jgi:CheY-like chemotaxis protein
MAFFNISGVPGQLSLPLMKRKPSILVVERSAEVQWTYLECLGDDYALTLVQDQEPLLTQLEGNIEIDLLITNMEMTRSNGYLFSRSFRKLCPETPILLVTGASEDDHRVRCLLEMENTAMLSKPFSGKELRLSVRALSIARTPSKKSPEGGLLSTGHESG